MDINTVPEHVLESETVFLHFKHGIPSNAKSIAWTRSIRGVTSMKSIMRINIETNQTEKGEVFTGRETIYRNGSLKIQNIPLDFSGFFMGTVYDKNEETTNGATRFEVYRK